MRTCIVTIQMQKSILSDGCANTLVESINHLSRSTRRACEFQKVTISQQLFKIYDIRVSIKLYRKLKKIPYKRKLESTKNRTVNNEIQ